MRFPVPKLWISSGNRVVESSEEANKRYYLSINLTCYLRSLQLVIVMRLRRDKKSKLLLQNDTSKVTTNVLLTDGVWISVFFLRIFILKLRINEIDFWKLRINEMRFWKLRKNEIELKLRKHTFSDENASKKQKISKFWEAIFQNFRAARASSCLEPIWRPACNDPATWRAFHSNPASNFGFHSQKLWLVALDSWDQALEV